MSSDTVTIRLLGLLIETGSKIYPTAQTYFNIAEYLSERGFAVLKYDKRGIGSNDTILDSNVWGNITINDLKEDAEKALSVLLQQPEVNATKKATLIGHNEDGVWRQSYTVEKTTMPAFIVEHLLLIFSVWVLSPFHNPYVA